MLPNSIGGVRFDCFFLLLLLPNRFDLKKRVQEAVILLTYRTSCPYTDRTIYLLLPGRRRRPAGRFVSCHWSGVPSNAGVVYSFNMVVLDVI